MCIFTGTKAENILKLVHKLAAEIMAWTCENLQKVSGVPTGQVESIGPPPPVDRQPLVPITQASSHHHSVRQSPAPQNVYKSHFQMAPSMDNLLLWAPWTSPCLPPTWQRWAVQKGASRGEVSCPAGTKKRPQPLASSCSPALVRGRKERATKIWSRHGEMVTP